LQKVKQILSGEPLNVADDAERKRVFRLKNNFKILCLNNTERLLDARSGRYFISVEEMFDVIHDVHLTTGHGGRDRILYEVKKKYANVTRLAVKTFIELCENCQLKQTTSRKSLIVKPIISDCFNARCQVDLIDWQSSANKHGYKFILNYQDHFTKFCILWPLKEKTAVAVAKELTDIFCLFGAP
ncbi:KRAB-A domain-containing protein 2, partial [Trichinella zimbabwensis]